MTSGGKCGGSIHHAGRLGFYGIVVRVLGHVDVSEKR